MHKFIFMYIRTYVCMCVYIIYIYTHTKCMYVCTHVGMCSLCMCLYK